LTFLKLNTIIILYYLFAGVKIEMTSRDNVVGENIEHVYFEDSKRKITVYSR